MYRQKFLRSYFSILPRYNSIRYLSNFIFVPPLIISTNMSLHGFFFITCQLTCIHGKVVVWFHTTFSTVWNIPSFRLVATQGKKINQIVNEYISSQNTDNRKFSLLKKHKNVMTLDGYSFMTINRYLLFLFNYQWIAMILGERVCSSFQLLSP